MANIPEGYHSVTPYLIVDDAKAAIDFYTRAFGAEEKFRLPMGEKIGHAEIKIGDSFIMLADEFPEMGHLGPKSRGGPTCSLMLYVEDVDTAFPKAVQAGRRSSGVEDILGRPMGRSSPVRPSMEPRHPHSRSAARRDEATDGESRSRSKAPA